MVRTKSKSPQHQNIHSSKKNFWTPCHEFEKLPFSNRFGKYLKIHALFFCQYRLCSLYIKNKFVLLFFCKLFFKSIMFGHNDNFLKRTFVCALSEYKRLIGYFVILKKLFSHKKCFSMRSYFLVFLLTVQF